MLLFFCSCCSAADSAFAVRPNVGCCMCVYSSSAAFIYYSPQSTNCEEKIIIIIIIIDSPFFVQLKAKNLPKPSSTHKLTIWLPGASPGCFSSGQLFTAMNSSAFIENLKQVFAECDTNNKGSLGRREFSELCEKIGLNKEAADETFARLDIDKNERITFDEFAAGFNQYTKQTAARSGSTSRRQSAAASPTSSSSPPKTSGGDSSRKPADSTTRSNAARPKSANLTPSLTPRSSASVSPFNARKNASPVGVMSLGSANSSSGNLAPGGGGGASHRSNSVSDVQLNGGQLKENLGANDGGDSSPTGSSGNNNNVVVYSSEHLAASGQGDAGSGQFGSLLSSNGSFSQLRNMQDLLECVQKLQSENQILTQIFFKDKREREEYISQLGEEFDQQVREVEERANKRAREELESEKKRLREMMQTERETLQHHYQTIEKMSQLIKSSAVSNKQSGEDADSIDKVKSKLEDTYLENRQLKRSLLDTKSDVAMIWKEMERLKRQYEDKLSNAYLRNNETRSECDHIKQQLSLMKDSNRKLQDASDVITNYITDKVEPVIKNTIGEVDGDGNLLTPSGSSSLTGCSTRPGGSQSNSRRGSILSQYLNGANQRNEQSEDAGHADRNSSNSTDAFNGSSVHSGDLESLAESSRGEATSSTTRAPYQQTRQLTSKLAKIELNNVASTREGQLSGEQEGTKTIKSSSHNDTDQQAQDFTAIRHAAQLNLVNHLANSRSINDDLSSSDSSGNFHATSRRLLEQQQQQPITQQQQQQRPQQHQQVISHQTQAQQKQLLKQHHSSMIELSKPTKSATKQSVRSKFGKRSLIGRHFFIGSRESAQSDAQISGANSEAEGHVDLKATSKSLSLDHAIDGPLVEPADGPSRATFDIILVGDSFVGKSSFAARFMEGSFVQGLISNCSIDFKTKAYKVDGINYTVNLWDTA